MSFRFLHAADIHLGFQQYGSAERFQDFFRAFDQVIAYAIEHKVDCVVLAGDLFHKRIIDPTTLYNATQAFIKLRNAGIKAVAVQGNHELPDPRQKTSWIDFLARMGLLIVLSVRKSENQVLFDPYDAKRCRGAYIDITPEIRIWGIKYLGASIRNMLTDVAEELDGGDLERAPYTISVLHAGLQGILEHYGGSLSRTDLECIRPHCDYLALGHIHKPYTQDDWVYNPGSTETNSLDEWFWPKRGFFDVTVEHAQVDGETCWSHQAQHVPTIRRKFLPLTLKVSGYETPDMLMAAVDRLLEQNVDQGDKPVVEFRLTGILAFDHSLLDRDAIETRVRKAYKPAVCRIKDNTQPAEFEIAMDDDMSSAQLERAVIQELVSRDASKRDNADAWAKLTLDIKQLALAGSEPQPVLDEIAAFCQSLAATDADEPEVSC